MVELVGVWVRVLWLSVAVLHQSELRKVRLELGRESAGNCCDIVALLKVSLSMDKVPSDPTLMPTFSSLRV